MILSREIKSCEYLDLDPDAISGGLGWALLNVAELMH